MNSLKEKNLYNRIVNTSAKYNGYLSTPIGYIEFLADDDYLLSVMFTNEFHTKENENDIIKEAKSQFSQYFSGERKTFSLPLKFNGTDFQNKVWTELINIPYGSAISYKELAIRVGNEKACRAVGGANSKNVLNIISPCHRVIGADSKLTGYGGGLDKKEWLLNFEKKNS